jgi:Na+-translocating ferredoxin:NAD+ oxidoreductase RnfE subunit
MNNPSPMRIFNNDASLSACLSGAALLIMASDRLAHAIAVTFALVWVYCLSVLTAHSGARFFPRRGRTAILVFLTSFFAGAFLLLLWFFSPLCALETFFVISIIPMFCIFSEIFGRLETFTLKEALSSSASESLLLGAFIVSFAFIREPLGYASLSLPGGAKGIVLIFSFDSESFFPVHLIAFSSGALLLLGYLLGMYRYFKMKNMPQEGKDGH